MTGGTSTQDVTTCISLSAGLFLATMPPLMRLARAEHLLPRAVRQAPLSAAALLLLLSAPPKGALR